MNDYAKDKRTLIGVLASHDSDAKNIQLARALVRWHRECEKDKEKDRFHFLFTGGTYGRILGDQSLENSGMRIEEALADIDSTLEHQFADTKQHLLNGRVSRLPPFKDGGVVILAYLVVQRRCNIVWPFLTTHQSHWLSCENLSMLRLCDVWRAKRIMNFGTAEEWIQHESETDRWRSLQNIPPKVVLRDRSEKLKLPLNWSQESDCSFKLQAPNLPDRSSASALPNYLEDWTIALIAHDEMKPRMLDFVVDYEWELAKFGQILATGTTGAQITNAAPKLTNVYRYHSGPLGGDIEIATEVLYGKCHAVIFFMDPASPHPHIEDIRVLLGACMSNESALTFTNDIQAREWMNRVIRRGKRTKSDES